MASKDAASDQLFEVFANNFDLDADYLGGLADSLAVELRRQENGSNPLPPSIHMRLKVGKLSWLIKEMRRLREGAGLTQEQVAGRLGVSVDFIHRRENGRNKFRPRDVGQLLDLYGVKDSALRAKLLAAAEKNRKNKPRSR